MNNDQIVSDLISLIHSTTQSNYVLCSQISSKIVSYFSRIAFMPNSWEELTQAIERFDQSFDHPDLQLFRQLIQTISTCSNDYEERNYTLGRDETILKESIRQLRNLLKSHVDLRCFLLRKLIEQQDIRLQLIDVMNLIAMNVGDEIHRMILEIIHLLCQIDPTFAKSSVIDHPMVLNTISMLSKHPIPVLNLLIDLVLTKELFPVQTNSQLSNEEFLKRIYQFIENDPSNEELQSTSIKFLLSFNLRFEYPEENPLLLTLEKNSEELSSRTLIEQLIYLFNRNNDPIGHSSIVKFLSDLHGENGDLFTDFNRRLIVEILNRELIDRICTNAMLTSYLSLLELILRHRSIHSIISTRVDELKECLQALLSLENCSEENLFIIKEIFRQHF